MERVYRHESMGSFADEADTAGVWDPFDYLERLGRHDRHDRQDKMVTQTGVQTDTPDENDQATVIDQARAEMIAGQASRWQTGPDSRFRRDPSVDDSRAVNRTPRAPTDRYPKPYDAGTESARASEHAAPDQFGGNRGSAEGAMFEDDLVDDSETRKAQDAMVRRLQDAHKPGFARDSRKVPARNPSVGGERQNGG